MFADLGNEIANVTVVVAACPGDPGATMAGVDETPSVKHQADLWTAFSFRSGAKANVHVGFCSPPRTGQNLGKMLETSTPFPKNGVRVSCDSIASS